PNSPNVIPESVYFTAEIRHPDDKIRKMMDAEFQQSITQVATTHGLDVTLNVVLDQPAAPFHPDCIQAIRQAASDNGFSYMDIISGAAHDAVAMSRIVPTGMVFVPCEKGISHNEAEYAEPADLAAGCQVLIDAV